MKTKKIAIEQLLRLFMTCSLSVFFATSCIDKKNNPDPVTNGGDTEKSVTFNLTLPGQSTGESTYGLLIADENEVNSIEVLLFASNGNYIETRTVSGSDISSVGNVKTFTVQIPDGDYSSLVVLANCNDIVFNAGLSTSDNKDATLAKLNVSGSAKWATDNVSGSFMAIPMWGDLGSVTIGQNTSSDTQTIPWSLNLTRMLAKVSVTLTSQSAIERFKLESIRVYNYYNQGSVVPATARWDSEAVKTASIPSGAGKPVITTPYTTLIYSGSEITTTEISCMNEIYLFESDNILQSDLTDRTCLVLGGTFTDDGEIYYYRVDFIENTSAKNVYSNILRNHHYKFNVTEINGPGYDTPDKAFSARPFNIETTVVVWNDTDIKNVSTDGQYMLGVSDMELNLGKTAYTSADTDNQLIITTDHPEGWTISSVIDDNTQLDATWLNVARRESDGATPQNISLLLDGNNSGSFRSAKVSVKAGNITVIVQVNQQAMSDTEVQIIDSTGATEITQLTSPS